MKYTTYINLRKPDENDFYNIADHNENMDKLDTEIQALKTKPATNLTSTEVTNLKAGKLATGNQPWLEGPYRGIKTIAIGLGYDQTYINTISLPPRSRPYTCFRLFLNGTDKNINVGVEVFGVSGSFHVTKGPYHNSQSDVTNRINTPGQWITNGLSESNTGIIRDKNYVIVGEVFDGTNTYYRGTVVDEYNKNQWYTCFNVGTNVFSIWFLGGYISGNNLKLVFKTSSEAILATKIAYEVD